MAVQPGLCRTWSETPKTGFLRTRLILHRILGVILHDVILLLSKGNKHNFDPLGLGKHYTNMSVQYTAIFHGCKNYNFQMKFFLYFSYFCSKHRLWVHVRTASADYCPGITTTMKNKKHCCKSFIKISALA